MKRFFSIVLAACCALTLSAQEVIPVSFMGEKPTITDFAWAFVSAIDDDEEVRIHKKEEAEKTWREFINKHFGIPCTIIAHWFGIYNLKEHKWTERFDK